MNKKSNNLKQPIAPPVYRPQPVPRVLQTKRAPGQNVGSGQASLRPAKPPIYRPQLKPAIAQTKMAGALLSRTHPVAPPVYRPQVKPTAVQQKSAGLLQARKHAVSSRSQLGHLRPPDVQRSGANGKSQALSRTNSIVQRYSVTDIRELGGLGKLSEGGDYFIPGSSGKLIYAATTAAPPRNSDADKVAPIAANSKNYQGYVSKKFFKDCLHTAEEIINRKDLVPHVDVYSKVSGTSEEFGNTDADNIRLATSHARDDKADPGLGHAYVIVNKKWLTKSGQKRKRSKVQYPYHAAAVVAVDGKDRVTLEVCASGSDAKLRDTDGEYSMYTTTGSGKTFHTHWQDEYFGGDSATVVIEPK